MLINLFFLYCCLGDSEEEFSDDDDLDEPPPPAVIKTPRVYESEISEPDLTKQPVKSALKKTPRTKQLGDSSVHSNFSTPTVGQECQASESASTAQRSPKATPVNQGPPRPKPRITLLR